MDRFESVVKLITVSPFLPNRRRERPTMIPNPYPVRCDIHREDQELRRLVEDVMTWRG
jgi:hypothetical protein